MVGGIVEIVKAYAGQVLQGIVILLIGFGLGVLSRKFALKIFREFNLNKFLGKIGITNDIENIVSIIISYVIYLFTIIIFLEKLLIKSLVLYLIAGGVITLLILSLLVGLKDVIPNFVGWIYLQRKKKIKEGKRVDVREISGRVERVGYLETEIKTDNGDILYVPNSLFLKSKLWIRH